MGTPTSSKSRLCFVRLSPLRHTSLCSLHFGLCSAMTSARLRSGICSFGYCSTATLPGDFARICPPGSYLRRQFTHKSERSGCAHVRYTPKRANMAQRRKAPILCPTDALFRPCSRSMMRDRLAAEGGPMSSQLSHSRSDVSTSDAGRHPRRSLSQPRSEVSTSLRGTEPLEDEAPRWTYSKNDNFPSIRPSRRKRARRALARFLMTLCIGVGGTLAWQSYGDAAREMIAKSSPQLSWLAPQAAAVQTPPAVPPNMVASAAPSPDPQQLKAMSLNIAAMRQSVNQLQNEITKLRAAQQEILDKISMPPPRQAAAQTHKPQPTPSSQQAVR